MELTVGQRLLDKLEVKRRLGAGGVGSVWEVEHLLTRRRHALKVLHQRFVGQRVVVERFVREASAAGRIEHPAIVECFDAGVLEDGSPYVLMELLQGEPLSVALGRDRSLSFLVWAAREACRGVAAAHQAGIVHRDLKPDNLFLARGADGRVHVKVLDFGVSRFGFDDRLTAEGAALGTPRYMSPEQMAGRPDVDGRSDVYSLGVMLYEGASGRPPFEAASLVLLAQLIHAGEAVPLEALAPNLPAGFGAVVRRAMHKDPAARFPDARALEAALEPYEAAGGTTLERTSPSFPAAATPAGRASPGLTTAPALHPAPPSTGLTAAPPAPPSTGRPAKLAAATAVLLAAAVAAVAALRAEPPQQPAPAQSTVPPVVAAPLQPAPLPPVAPSPPPRAEAPAPGADAGASPRPPKPARAVNPDVIRDTPYPEPR